MRLRPYESLDQSVLAEVWFDGWRSVGLARPVTTLEDMAARVPRELAGRWTVTVAELDGKVVGFLALALAEDRLDQLFVQAEAQGRGVGAALFDVAAARLPASFWLSTQMGNHRARAFYEARGMVLDRTEGTAGEERAIYVMRPKGRNRA